MSKSQVFTRKRKRESDAAAAADDEARRKSASTFSNLIRTMFKNRVDTDVTLKVKLDGESKDIECHSFILTAHSPVLRAMISERWTKDKDNQRIITLTGDNPHHFAFFVDMLYWDWNGWTYETNFSTSGLTTEIIVGVLSLALKYLACHIVRLAGHLIHSCLNLGVEVNVVKLYSLLKCLPICDVDQAAWKNLRTVENCLLGCVKKVFSSKAILEMTQSALLEIVQKNELRCKEDTVFSGCFKWAKEQCKLKELSFSVENMRSVLGNVIKFIRFPLLEEATVINEVLDANILTQEELVELLAYIIRKTSCQPLKRIPLRFSREERDADDEFEIKRLDVDTVAENLVDFSTPHGFLLTISKTVELCGLRIYGGTLSSKERKFHLTLGVLGEPNKSEYYCSFDNFDAKIPGNKTTLVTFPSAVIKADTQVLIKFSIKGGRTHVSQETVEKVTKEIVYWEDEVITCTFRSCLSLPNGLKQIPTLIFCPEIPERSNFSPD